MIFFFLLSTLNIVQFTCTFKFKTIIVEIKTLKRYLLSYLDWEFVELPIVLSRKYVIVILARRGVRDTFIFYFNPD